MGQPLLSIVIPTKDRYFYLKHLLSFLLEIDSENVEIVIQDNTEDNSEFLEYLNGINYEKFVYHHTKEQIPISLNSDMAIKNSSGKYVCFIGDDDGVTSLIVPCVRFMEKRGIEVVVPTTVSYNWPDSFNASSLLKESAQLKFSDFSGKIKMVDPIETLYNLMKQGCTYRGELPLLYHGIVKRSTLDKIYEKCNTYFPGPSPDIANGVALSLLECKYAKIDMPIIISGASKFHGGGVRKMKNRAADINDVPFLPPKAKENWEKRIPKIWTGETVWCESAVKAMRYMGRDDLAEQVNYEALYVAFVTYNFALKKMAYELSINKPSLFWNSSKMILRRYKRGAMRVLKRNKNNDNIIVRECDNIEAVIKCLDDSFYNKYAKILNEGLL